MRYLSLFSGIEAASVAWEHLGWQCAGFSEIEKFPCAVLQHHFPDIPNLGDITKITEEQIKSLGRIDLIVGGFPCQDVSVSGKRKGFKDENGHLTRSGLFFTAMQIVEWARKHNGLRFVLFENVKGLFSSNKGADFATVVNEMVGGAFSAPKKWHTEGCAVGDRGFLEWCLLDAQWFGLAQRRPRVFALADFGDWSNRPPILLELKSMSGYTAPRRETVKDNSGSTADGVARCITTGEGFRYDWETCTLISSPYVASPLATRNRLDLDNGTYIVFAQNQVGEVRTSEICPSLTTNSNASGRNTPMVFKQNDTALCFNVNAQPDEMKFDPDISSTLTTSQYAGVLGRNLVRRLTPLECERLQGFPDNWTAIPFQGKPASDGPRYKALGNSMPVTVMDWIGRRVNLVTELY